jgi:hypothetical protein
MGNCALRATEKLRVLMNLRYSSRAVNYDFDENNDIQNYVPMTGFRIEQTCRHSEFEHSHTLREACSLRSSSPESSDVICDVKFCTNRQALLDSVLDSDDQHQVVAAIGKKSAVMFFLTDSYDSFSNSQPQSSAVSTQKHLLM